MLSMQPHPNSFLSSKEAYLTQSEVEKLTCIIKGNKNLTYSTLFLKKNQELFQALLVKSA